MFVQKLKTYWPIPTLVFVIVISVWSIHYNEAKANPQSCTTQGAK